MEALKENPGLLNYFAFFSDLHEHFRNKTTNPLMIGRNVNLEFVFIRAVKAFREIGEKVAQVLETLDPDFRLPRREGLEGFRSVKSFRGGDMREELKQLRGISFNDKFPTPNAKKRNLDILPEEVNATTWDKSPGTLKPLGAEQRHRERIQPRKDFKAPNAGKHASEEVKEEEVRVRIEEIPMRTSELDENISSEGVTQQPQLEGTNSLGAASYLMKHNALARAMMVPREMPGWRMKDAPLRQPLPIKEISDEDLSEEFENEINAESANATKRLREAQRSAKKRAIPKDKFNAVLELLYEALNITREQSESMSEIINEAEAQYFLS